MTKADYSQEDLALAIRNVGICAGDVVSLQVSLGRLGLIQDVPMNIKTYAKTIIKTFLEVLGKNGTLIVPTYTYSIGRGELFDIQNTPSAIGEFSEIFRTYKGAVRSRDPMLSHSAIGPKAVELMFNISNICFGTNSVFDRLYKINAKICTLGIGLHWATFRHYIERMANVPFRFDKVFEGNIIENEKIKKEKWTYFAAPKNIINCASDGVHLERIAEAKKIKKMAKLGRGYITCIEAKKYFNLGFKELQKNPWLTAKGPVLTETEIAKLKN